MITCFRCAKIIKGKMVCTNPPVYLIKMGVDFPKSFHPKCYDKAEKEAEKELHRR
mgnify:FL=1